MLIYIIHILYICVYIYIKYINYTCHLNYSKQNYPKKSLDRKNFRSEKPP